MKPCRSTKVNHRIHRTHGKFLRCILYWSAEDQAFVAEVPELPGCMAHGLTQEDALNNAKQAIALWVETAREFGDPVPEPKGRRLVYA